MPRQQKLDRIQTNPCHCHQSQCLFLPYLGSGFAFVGAQWYLPTYLLLLHLGAAGRKPNALCDFHSKLRLSPSSLPPRTCVSQISHCGLRKDERNIVVGCIIFFSRHHPTFSIHQPRPWTPTSTRGHFRHSSSLPDMEKTSSPWLCLCLAALLILCYAQVPSYLDLPRNTAVDPQFRRDRLG